MKHESPSDALLDGFRRHVGQTSHYPPSLEVEKAAGCRITDSGGKQYLDFIAGIAVTSVGHCHPAVVQAVQEQAAKYAHTMVYGEHVQRPQVEFARAVARLAPPPLDAVYLLTTGAETNDAALKMAAKLTGRQRFIAFEGAYHGCTLGALSCLGDSHFREAFQPLLLDVDFLPFGDFDALGRVDETIAGVLVEPVQGEAGIRVPPDGWLAALRRQCDRTGAMLIFDEVQTGFGRLGSWFAAEHFGVTPDIITAAKGMGGGMPLAGLIARHEAITRFAAEPPFSHINTFGGHPVSCAAGLAALRVIESDGLLANAVEQGHFLRERLGRAAAGGAVREVRGLGLMIGVAHEDAEVARGVINLCREKGLIVESNLLDERVIRFSPALTVTHAECDEAVAIYETSLREAVG